MLKQAEGSENIISFKGAEKAYDDLSKEIDNDFRVELAPELFIHERAMKIEKIERNPLLKHKSSKQELDSESFEAL